MDHDLVSFNAAYPGFFATIVIIFGALMGSFLNVVIHRVPRGQSMVTPGSRCACGQPIAWHDNIPIVSWFMLRGTARCCGQTFSFRYVVVEVLTATLFLLCWLTHSPAVALVGMVMISLLVAAAFIDWAYMIIPDSITIGGTVGAVALAGLVPALHGHSVEPVYWVGSIRGMLSAVVGACIGSALIMWIGLLAEAILQKEAMGFGDVKFMGLIGAFLGWPGAVFTIGAGAMVGTVWFAVAFIRQKMTGTGSRPILPTTTPDGEETGLGLGAQVPFGPMLAIAALGYLIGGERHLAPYLDRVLAAW